MLAGWVYEIGTTRYFERATSGRAVLSLPSHEMLIPGWYWFVACHVEWRQSKNGILQKKNSWMLRLARCGQCFDLGIEPLKPYGALKRLWFRAWFIEDRYILNVRKRTLIARQTQRRLLGESTNKMLKGHTHRLLVQRSNHDFSDAKQQLSAAVLTR